MSVELTLTKAEKALLPYMTNELYDKNHSVIAKHFPIKQDVGRRLVDSGLFTSAEYVEICSSQENFAGSRLICSLTRKGDDSMKTFYKVLLRSKGERDVDVILHSLEADAEKSRKDSGFDSQLDLSEEQPRDTYDSKADLAMKRISELENQIRQLSSTVAELQQSIDRLERQYPMIVIQALPSQPTGPLGSHTASTSSLSSFMTAPSRSNSARSDSSNDYAISGNFQMGGRALTMYTAVTNYNLRRLSLPPIPTQPSRSGSQPGNKHASGNGSIPEREDPLSCSHQLHSPDMRQVSAVKSEEKEYQQLQVTAQREPPRHRRYGTAAINPLKAIAKACRRLSQSGHDAEGKT